MGRLKMSNTSLEKLITVDGLASSGKSTLARKLAEKLNWPWFSTGVLYRAMAYIISHTENFKEEDYLKLFESKEWYIQLSLEKTCFFYKGQDRTAELYSEKIDERASHFSSFEDYRKKLLPYQRSFYKKEQGLILEGRDCGTVLFPEAPLKIFLSAGEEQRAIRRAKERSKSKDIIFQSQKERDHRDETRSFAPTVCPEGALNLNSDKHSPEELVDIVYQKAQALFF